MTPVVDALDRLGIAYYVGGSLASSTHGAPRSTRDVDLVAAMAAHHAGPFARSLESEYYVDEEAVREAIQQRRSFNAIHLGTMIKVDVFIPAGQPFDRSELARARPEKLEESPSGRAFMVASPEDIILRKMIWYRMTGERSDRQWDDVIGVFRVQLILDDAYLDRWAGELGVADLLARARQDADR
jgi:hypothetical protein